MHTLSGELMLRLPHGYQIRLWRYEQLNALYREALLDRHSMMLEALHRLQIQASQPKSRSHDELVRWLLGVQACLIREFASEEEVGGV